jgi:hypothetical protein
VNSKHALISEFDGSASSSGSMDLQTLPPPGQLAQLIGPFSFVVSGKASNRLEIFGGNITANGNGGLHVIVDQNKAGVVTLNGSNTGTYTAPDGVGRGTMSFGLDNFSYYVVNPKVFRLLVTSFANPDVGSAYAGVTGATNATLNTKFVFADSSNMSAGALFAAAGLVSADGNGNITGFADVDENGTSSKGSFSGTYTVNSSGYGSITITPNGNLQDVSVLGLYLADPTINFSDPNSPADAGLRGLLIDLDPKIPGSGMLILPGTGVTAPSGIFALSIQTSNTNKEADSVGVVTITGAGLLSGTESTTGQAPAVSISGTVAADPINLGRLLLPLAVTVGATPPTFSYVLYPASHTQIIVLENDSPQYGLGILEQ